MERLRPGSALALLVGGLAAANVARSTIVPGAWHLPFNVGLGLFSLGVAAGTGLGRRDLGLDRAGLRCGARLGTAAFAVISVGVLALGSTGGLSGEKGDLSAAEVAVRALVVIPLGTVLAEELAFRGTLHALLERVGGRRWAWAGGAVLFGLWHVFPAWRGGTVDSDLADVGRAASTAATFAATTAAGLGFIWLRVRSESLVAPVLAHLATNSVTFALAWAFR